MGHTIEILKDDPFHIKQVLRKKYPEVIKKEIDLSRGEPYNSPDIVSDSIYAGFLIWSVKVSEIIGDKPLKLASDEAVLKVKSEISKYPYISIDLIDYTLEAILKICRNYGIKVNKLELIKSILSGIRGEDYSDLLGEKFVRAIVADKLHQAIRPPANITFKPDDVILTIGGSEAIGALVEIFDSIDLFDKNSKKVAMLSPLYSPYSFIFKKMGVDVFTISGDEHKGFEPNDEELNKLADQASNIALLILVNPSNPAGVSLSPKTLKKLSDIVVNNQIIVVTDVVYAPFILEPMDSIITYAPENTILIGSGSKFYQETGTRFGFILLTDKANIGIGKIIGDKIQAYYGKIKKDKQEVTLRDAIEMSKGPDPFGTFYHTHHVPTPIQWLGAFRLITGYEDAKKFSFELKERWTALYHGLGLLTPKEKFPEAKYVPYYALIDLREVAEVNNLGNLLNKMTDGTLKPDQMIEYLYKDAHVLMLPAATFFPGKEEDNVWKLRFSVANQPIENIKRATYNIIQLLKKLNNSL